VWILRCWVHMCQHVICSYVVDDEGGILQSIDANKLPIIVVVDEFEGALLDGQWPFDVPPESKIQAVASSCVQTPVTVANGTGASIDKMTHGSPHADPWATECFVDKRYLLPHCCGDEESCAAVVHFLCSVGRGEATIPHVSVVLGGLSWQHS
jgi:hypothetical protein